MSGSPEGMYEPGIVDPGIPVPNPTTPFWHTEPHPLANHQSPWPTSPVDILVIGAGMTGTSLAHALQFKQPSLRIVVVDARGLCSGATGRNGGHIKTMSFASWPERKRIYGAAEAIRLTAFEHSHLAALTSAARASDIDCALTPTSGVDAYFDQRTFDAALAALADMRSHAPHLADAYVIHADREHLRRVLKLSDRCVGAIAVPAASVWPYKLVTGLMGRLIERGVVNVQTHTAVRAVDDSASSSFTVVHTDRGDIAARHVVHATNGWLGHLLPELRPLVSPVRGNVVHYAGRRRVDDERGAASSPLGLAPDFSYWLHYAPKDYDYLIQRPAPGSGVVVGRANLNRRATGDDSETDIVAMAHLCGFAHEVVATPAPPPPIPPFSSPSTCPPSAILPTPDHAWSGILGFTQDGAPFVGRLPPAVFPGRGGQWVCGGYHGVGMVKAFRAAEMLARLMVGGEGEGLAEEFPLSMLVTEERIRRLREELDGGTSGGKLKGRL